MPYPYIPYLELVKFDLGQIYSTGHGVLVYKRLCKVYSLAFHTHL